MVDIVRINAEVMRLMMVEKRLLEVAPHIPDPWARAVLMDQVVSVCRSTLRLNAELPKNRQLPSDKLIPSDIKEKIESKSETNE